MSVAPSLAKRIDPRHRTAVIMTLVALGMLGLGFASVPLYRLFCAATGLNGTTMRGTVAPGAVAGHQVVIRFDANHANSLPWDFRPEATTHTVTVGERNIAFYVAHNRSTETVTGTAAFNVSPALAGQYFSKIECFCFTEQTLKAGETVRMPVIFYVDPKILQDPDIKDVREITLSYTFARTGPVAHAEGAIE